MAVILGLCVVVIYSWVVDGNPVKEQKDIVFSTDMSNNLGPKRFFGPNVAQFQPEVDWMYQLMDSLDGRSTRQKRQVKKPPGRNKGLPRKSKSVNGKRRVSRRKPVQNGQKGLPEREKDGNFKKSLRDILILGTKKDKTSTQRKNGRPSSSSQKKPRRSNNGSFSIVPAKPKPRRGWRSRFRPRARARARSGSRKQKKITVRRGFVILD